MPLSTHVLDAVTGAPAAGVSITLRRRADAATRPAISRAITGPDGRIADLAANLEPGDYQLVIDSEGYFAKQSYIETPFYPEIVITFRVVAADARYHLPVLLSPFGYSTYRGS
ncbi:MAG: hydroxyisourate hydrolase [Jatrophihabitans sp.]